MVHRPFVGMLLCGLLAAMAAAQEADPPRTAYTADWDSLRQHKPAPDWFRDAKFGIYMHWGVYSVPAYRNEWYPRNMHFKDEPEYKHHVEKYGEPSEFGYHDFIPLFSAEHFDPDEWARLFVRAGARYAGLVAEHHDGFSMWHSALTPYNAGDMGPKRDIVGELGEAIHKQGMKFFTSFHHARNPKHYPKVEGWPTTDPQYAMLYGTLSREQFLDLWLGKLKEVVDNYDPDIVYFDSFLDDIPDEQKTAFLAHYFNLADQRGKEVMVTYKQDDLPEDVGVRDYEKNRADQITEFAWLTDTVIARGSWCYTDSLKIKETRELIHVLADIVSKNGQLVLNISPKSDGIIPSSQRQVLTEIGDWLEKFGEAIYETRPFVVYGQGPTKIQRGRRFLGPTEYTPQDVRYTTKGDMIYAILLGWPGAGHQTALAAFAPDQRPAGMNVTGVSALGTDEPIAWSLEDDGLHVTSPSAPPDEIAFVYKIETAAQ